MLAACLRSSSGPRRHDCTVRATTARLDTILPRFQHCRLHSVIAHEAVHDRAPRSLRFQHMVVYLGIHRTLTSRAIHHFSVMYLTGAVLPEFLETDSANRSPQQRTKYALLLRFLIPQENQLLPALASPIVPAPQFEPSRSLGPDGVHVHRCARSRAPAPADLHARAVMSQEGIRCIESWERPRLREAGGIRICLIGR